MSFKLVHLPFEITQRILFENNRWVRKQQDILRKIIVTHTHFITRLYTVWTKLEQSRIYHERKSYKSKKYISNLWMRRKIFSSSEIDHHQDVDLPQNSHLDRFEGFPNTAFSNNLRILLYAKTAHQGKTACPFAQLFRFRGKLSHGRLYLYAVILFLEPPFFRCPEKSFESLKYDVQ